MFFGKQQAGFKIWSSAGKAEISVRMQRISIIGMMVLLGWSVWGTMKEPEFEKERICMVADSEAGITGREVEQIRKNENSTENPVKLTAWNQKRGQTVTATRTDRAAFSVPVISINGSSENLIPYGKILHEEDKEGCLIGAETAEQLFGSREVEGLSVCYDGQEFFVRGVLKTPEHFLMFQETAEDASFYGICIRRTDGTKSHRMETENFRNRYGLPMICKKSRNRLPTMEEIGEMIPGKWSDFEAWKENFAEWGDAE